MTRLTGIGVSSGVARGSAVRMPAPIPEPPHGVSSTSNPDVDGERIRQASKDVANDLMRRVSSADAEAQEVLEATALMAQDPTLVNTAIGLLNSESVSPERAVWEAGEAIAAQLKALGGRMAERSSDVKDVRARIVAKLLGLPAPGVPSLDHPFVLVATDLAPADTAGLDPHQVLAIVTRDGGATSHTAILARELGIPGVVGVDGADGIAEGDDLLVDAIRGQVVIGPTTVEVDEAVDRAEKARARHFDGHGHTLDGHPVQLLANVGDAESAVAAAKAGAEGIGLFRTEFCFLSRTDAPSVAEQAAQYRQVMEAFPHHKVVFRTLDAGADKPLPFLGMPEEPNPALGVRGWRIGLTHANVLNDQLAAIAQAAQGLDTDVWVMAPMIATVEDAEDFAQACARHKLRRPGAMVEVPSAAMMSEEILTIVDFVSLGTNDLTQYTMAADRMASVLSKYADPWQPGLLRMVNMACMGGAATGKPVGVCGEAAANPALAIVLVGLGVTSLSMSAKALPDVAAVLAATTFDTCQELAQVAIGCSTAGDAKIQVHRGLPVLDELGLT